jgi:hypothetical protein
MSRKHVIETGSPFFEPKKSRAEVALLILSLQRSPKALISIALWKGLFLS